MPVTALPHWEHFSHLADIGVRGYGDSPAQAFEQAALALTAVIGDLAAVQPMVEVTFDCEAPDLELLLVDWLNALVYEMAIRKLLFGRFQVTLDGTRLRGSAWGEPVDRIRHQPAVEIKAATYTELKVCPREEGGWLAQCVVDV